MGHKLSHTMVLSDRYMAVCARTRQQASLPRPVPTDTFQWRPGALSSDGHDAFRPPTLVMQVVGAARYPAGAATPGSHPARVQALLVEWSHTNGWPSPGR